MFFGFGFFDLLFVGLGIASVCFMLFPAQIEKKLFMSRQSVRRRGLQITVASILAGWPGGGLVLHLILVVVGWIVGGKLYEVYGQKHGHSS